MTKGNTKNLITKKALDLFSQYGYDGVSVKDIALAVGIKDSSLYKHFPSKQAIFDSILNESDIQYASMAESLGMGSGNQADEDAFKYVEIDISVLTEMCINLFQYFLHDDFASKLRKMLTIEQYRNTELAQLFYERYIAVPIRYQSTIFTILQQQKGMQVCDTELAALQFYSPIYLLLCQCDTYPEKETQCLSMIEKHVGQFSSLYMGK